MVRPSVLFIADVRDERNSTHHNIQFANNPSQNEKYTKITPTHNQKTDSETAFKNINQGEKVLCPNYVFHNLFHAISGR